MTSEFDDRSLHPETDPEIRDLVFARVTDRSDLALHATLTEPARDQNCINTIQ